MLYPNYNLVMLAFESASVINKRLAKIGRGGTESLDEIHLMFAEKAGATIEATTAAMLGRTYAGTIARYRELVAGNELRLSACKRVSACL